jgi:hypothetical protein
MRKRSENTGFQEPSRAVLAFYIAIKLAPVNASQQSANSTAHSLMRSEFNL